MEKNIKVMSSHSLLLNILCVVALVAGAAAQRLPFDSTLQTLQRPRFNRRQFPEGTLPYRNEVASWMSPTAASSQNPLVYVSFITGQTTGGTKIYEITSANGKQQAQLMGTLGNGGGGPVAVDAQQNVYVIQADLDSNVFQVSAAVYRYARGSTQGTLLFTVPNFGAYAMTVGPDGSVYMAGQVPESVTFPVMKLSPPDYTPELLSNSQNPEFPIGISLDAAGNLFVGWEDSFTGLTDPCGDGCIMELPAGQSTWQLRVPDFAANLMAAGPFVTPKGALVFWTGAPGQTPFDYLETVPSGSQYPSQVIQVPPALIPFASGGIFAYSGSELWVTVYFFGAGPGTNVIGIDYPKGNIVLKFPVEAPPDFFLLTGIAASPAVIL